MSSPKFASNLYLLALALLLQNVVGLFSPVYHTCSNLPPSDKNKFKSDLNQVMASLRTRTPTTGFSTVSSEDANLHGLAFCKTINSRRESCKTCVVEASIEIQRQCPSNRAAVIWYDDCMLKYSSIYFFGKVDFNNFYAVFNNRSAGQPDKFNTQRNNLLEHLIDEASVNPKFSASGKTDLKKLGKLYGLAQCTRDLPTGADCKKCLKYALKLVRTDIDAKLGGQAGTGSCSIRYEMYPFFT